MSTPEDQQHDTNQTTTEAPAPEDVKLDDLDAPEDQAAVIKGGPTSTQWFKA